MSRPNGVIEVARVIFSRFPAFLVALMAIALIAPPVIPGPLVETANFPVASFADTVDINPGDGQCRDSSGNCTLRAAIMEANALSGIDTINLPAGTYTLTIPGANEDIAATGDLDISDDLTINGAGQSTTIIDGGSLDRVFHISGGSVVLSDIWVRNGLVSGGTHPSGVGGGIYMPLGDLTINNSTISDNTAEFGGGINLENQGTTLNVNNSSVCGNTANDGGGGIHSTSNTLVTIIDSIICGNVALGSTGGGIRNSGALTVSNSTISDNKAITAGGGINNGSKGTVDLNSSTIIHNEVIDGTGGGIGGGFALNITGSIITGNIAARRGGGISNADTTNITNSTISGNTANDNGGGITNAGQIVNVTNSTISGNRVLSGRGGGIHNGTDGSGGLGTLTISNSTISGNQASDLGGGIFAAADTTINLSHVTVTSNVADSDDDGSGTGGGINFRPTATANVKNTIIARNLRLSGSSRSDCVGSLNSQGHNLIGRTSGCTITGDTTSNITGRDPLLDSLRDNDGPTHTHAPVPGSPVIDAIPIANCTDLSGNPVTIDQRGIARPQGPNCDIGAFERAPSDPVPRDAATISGTVYANSADPGSELPGARVELCDEAFCSIHSTNDSGQYSSMVLAGTYRIRAFPPSGTDLLPGRAGPLSLLPGDSFTQDIVLLAATPLDPNVTVSPSNEPLPGGNPVVYWKNATTYTKDVTNHCAANSPVAVKLVVGFESGRMAEQMMDNTGGETWEATFLPFQPEHGPALLTFYVDCPPDTPGFPEDVALMSPEDETQIGGHIYIDPSGRVLDTNGSPIAGATATLFRSDNSSGPFEQVPNGSDIMSPSNRNNPDTTDVDGAFGWDVIAGFYVVRAEAPGCVSPDDSEQGYVESDVLAIPPPVTDLELILACTPTSLEADPSFNLLQDPSNGATGFKVDITRVFDPSTDIDVAVLLESFQAQLTYDGSCVNVLDVRGMDIPITGRNIDNTVGVATFGGSDASGVPWPADLGHTLTRLTGSASQQCQVDLEMASLTDSNGEPIAVPTVLSQTVQRGDARADGDITIADALFIAQYLVGLRDECTATVDTNCLHPVNAASVRHDGAFDQKTIADALFIAQHLVGLRDEFYNLAP